MEKPKVLVTGYDFRKRIQICAEISQACKEEDIEACVTSTSSEHGVEMHTEVNTIALAFVHVRRKPTFGLKALQSLHHHKIPKYTIADNKKDEPNGAQNYRQQCIQRNPNYLDSYKKELRGAVLRHLSEQSGKYKNEI
ncbi:hypothetical protein HY486_01835 [Candidatus Woesearchaeota archaeon]|nr:hypothetical protein [Candidatus Woesearchaeota archaeon]